MNPAAEEWRPIPGWEGFYEASSLGRIRSLRRTGTPGKIRKPRWQGNYWFLTLSGGGRRQSGTVHRLILRTFGGEPPAADMECRHLDGNPNNNRIDNLAWGSASQNQDDSIGHGTHDKSRRTHCPKGHPYDEANTLIKKRGPGRRVGRDCRTCNNERFRERRRRLRGNTQTPAEVTPAPGGLGGTPTPGRVDGGGSNPSTRPGFQPHQPEWDGNRCANCGAPLTDGGSCPMADRTPATDELPALTLTGTDAR